MKQLFSIAQGLVTGVAALFVLVVAASFFPIPGTIELFSVRSGSMEPAVHTGSLILVRPATEYSVGDIVTIRSDEEGKTITHRVAGIRDTEGGRVFVTKGDANEEADQEEIGMSSIIGKTILVVPYLGYPVAYAQTKQGFLWLIVAPAVLIVLGELSTIFQEIRSLIRKRRETGGNRAPAVRDITFSREPSAVPPIPHRETVSSSPVRRRKLVW